MINLSNFQYRD